ncbi:hypothetical protein BGZ74_007626 [Mortierella antarctica]|nr:hypothetical protein BGZ74_007626 [Mortierella antarctica]
MTRPVTEIERGHFDASLRAVRFVLGKRINIAAQISLANDILCIAVGLRSASLVDQLYLNKNDIDRFQSLFHHANLLSIGDDHVFIIHRQLLLLDIQDYLSGSGLGLQRVFINVDYRLAKPEVMPNNRYRALEDYIRQVLLPEVRHRIESWNEAEVTSKQLPLPNKKELSLVTLTGWMLSYPVNYVLPCNATRRYQRWLAYQQQQQQSTTDADGHDNGYDSDTEEQDEDNTREDDEDDDEDSGRNCLANQVLVVTRIHLEPNSEVEGLHSHCLLSFSYPAELAERWVDPSALGPESPLSPAKPQRERDVEAQGLVPEDQISLGGIDKYDSDHEPSHQEEQGEQDQDQEAQPEYEPMPGAYEPCLGTNKIRTTAPIPARRLPRSSTFRSDKQLPFSNPDICAAGRTFLGQFHTRFQKQTIWQSWEVGQESVTLPVVAM